MRVYFKFMISHSHYNLQTFCHLFAITVTKCSGKLSYDRINISSIVPYSKQHSKPESHDCFHAPATAVSVSSPSLIPFVSSFCHIICLNLCFCTIPRTLTTQGTTKACSATAHVCSHTGCTKTELFEILCPNCGLNFCLL